MKISNYKKSDVPVALITGASRGLGRDIAMRMAKDRYSIILNYLSSEKKAFRILQEINGDSLAIKADVSDLKQVEAMAQVIEKEFGRLDVIVNNAGIAKDNLLIKQTEQEWDNVISTNLKGCFNIIRTMAPIMIKSNSGHIINISSYSGIKGKTGQASYSASKASIIGLTLTAAKELAEYNIRVNAVLPGYMKTEMGTKAISAMKKAKADSIMKKLSEPSEVAVFIVYLLQTRNITGQVFSIDSRII